MRNLIETLEDRRLMSVRPEGVVSGRPVAETAPLIHKGVLAVNGSSGDDNISIRVEANRKGKLYVVIRVVSGKTVDGKLNGRFTRSVGVPVEQVPFIVVTGNGGNDQLETDETAYKFTKSIDVDARVVSMVLPNGRTSYIEDPMSQPIVGVLGGSVSAWRKKSNSDIVRLKDPSYSTDVAFVGDSHINYLSQTGATVFKEKFGSVSNVNLGLAGDTTSQMLYRIKQQDLVLAGGLKLVVLEVGTNNVALSDDVNAIFRGIKAVVLEIRAQLPYTKILINSILPRRANAENKVINKVNDQLATLDNGRGVRFLNVTPQFSGERALQRYYRPDSIHLNSRGYRVWIDQLAPLMDQMI